MAWQDDATLLILVEFRGGWGTLYEVSVSDFGPLVSSDEHLALPHLTAVEPREIGCFGEDAHLLYAPWRR